MNKKELDLILLGISIGTLGALEEVRKGKPASDLEDAARQILHGTADSITRDLLYEKERARSLHEAIDAWRRKSA